MVEGTIEFQTCWVLLKQLDGSQSLMTK